MSLPSSITLAAVASLNGAFLVWTRPSATAQQLRHDADSRKGAAAEVTIDGDKFESQQRLRKIATVVAITILAGLQCFKLGWTSTAASPTPVEIASDALMAYADLLLIAIAVASMHASTHDRSWDYLVSLSLVLSLELALSLFRIVVPRSVSQESHPRTAIDIFLVVATTVMEAIALALASTTPRQARLYHLRLDAEPKGVTLLASCSPLSYLLFTWATPVLKLGAKLETFTQEDVPDLAEKDQAPRQWRRIKSQKASAPPGVNNLLWRVLLENRFVFGWQCILAVITAVIYYLPAFFLHALVGFLEEGPHTSLRVGYAYTLGLFAALLLDAVVQGQLWFLSNTMLSTRIRTQLNALVFEKTLKRKDIAGLSGAGAAEGDEAPANSSAANGHAKPDAKKKKKKEKKKGGLFGLGDAGKDGFTSRTAVMNVFSIDTDRVADFSVWSFSMIDAPVEVIVGMIFLYQLIGWSAFVGISVAVLFLPLNHVTSSQFAKVQDRLMSARDRRVSMTNEVLSSGIRMIKYMAWEGPFVERILQSRAHELYHLRNNFLLEVMFNFVWTLSPVLCILVSFVIFTKVMHQPLTPSTAFAALAVWNELKFALNVIPDLVVNAVQCLVSLRRIEAYLDSPELDDQALLTDGHAVDSHSEAPKEVAFKDATVTWPRNPAAEEDNDSDDEDETASTAAPQTFELQDISVNFPMGELSLICGQLGSGKTLMLLALLNEADVLEGAVVCPRSSPDTLVWPTPSHIAPQNWHLDSATAFVPQSAWLLNASVKDNILFGLPLWEERYQAVIDACSLRNDLTLLEDGDDTEIGESGVNLSGGQKARVSLARAIYSRASVLLLDDCLSAVDAHTAKHIYEKCIKGPLLADRTTILVSHHVQLTAPGAAYLVALDNGRVKYEGSPSGFLKTDTAAELEAEEEELPAKPPKRTADRDVSKSPSRPRHKALEAAIIESRADSGTSSAESESESEFEDGAETPAKIEEKKTPRKFTEDEQRAVGHVAGWVWKAYLLSCGFVVFWFCFLIIFCGAKLSEVGETFWLNRWSGSYVEDPPRHSVDYYLVIYTVLTLLTVTISTLQWFVLYFGTLRASSRLYAALLKRVVRAPLRFYDTVPTGRLINRFGKDFEGIDSQLPDHWGRSLMYLLGLMTTIVTITSVTPWFLLGFALLSTLYMSYARLYSKSAREFRRLDSVTKSPLFSVYGEAIAGAAVIRSFGASGRFMSMMLERCTTNVTFYWQLWSSNRWLSLRFMLVSAVVVGICSLALLAAGDRVDASLAGFSLTFALQISYNILFLVRRYTALELGMVSVERVLEYTKIEQEAPEVVEPRPPAIWPHAGHIEVNQLTVRYAPELPDILHAISFDVAAGHKVGCVGATGSGKSSLASTMFRFVEPWSGSIKIDGLDITKIGLKDLRSRLTIIPQDPVILSGTLRTTLDIFNEHTDEELFDSLRRVHLITDDNDPGQQDENANRSPFYNLETEVSEGGGNFSQGQRQLLCMARALLRRSKVLILDEATASIDYETDEQISKTIRAEFRDSTLLVVAHRLRTIIDFDKVLVLDQGRVLEYDTPANLIGDLNSRFHALCRATGRSEFKILKKMAEGKAKVEPKLPRRPTRRRTTSLGTGQERVSSQGKAAGPGQ